MNICPYEGEKELERVAGQAVQVGPLCDLCDEYDCIHNLNPEPEPPVLTY